MINNGRLKLNSNSWVSSLIIADIYQINSAKIWCHDWGNYMNVSWAVAKGNPICSAVTDNTTFLCQLLSLTRIQTACRHWLLLLQQTSATLYLTLETILQRDHTSYDARRRVHVLIHDYPAAITTWALSTQWVGPFFIQASSEKQAYRLTVKAAYYDPYWSFFMGCDLYWS